MDESQQKIEDKLLEILSKEILSISELSRRLNVKRYILAGYLEALREQGKVDVFKVGKAKVYVVKEKLKKGLWLIFFLAFIPFLFYPAHASIELTFSSNKIWLLNINGNFSYLSSIFTIRANCSIVSAFLNSSEELINLVVKGNEAYLDTSLLNKELLSRGETYSLNLSCENESTSVPLNISYLEVSSSLFDKAGSTSLFEDSSVIAKISLEENNNPVSQVSNLSVRIDGNSIENVSYKYLINSNEFEIPIGKLTFGKHVVEISFNYQGLPVNLIHQAEVKKNIQITSLSSSFLSSNSSLTIALSTNPSITLDVSMLNVYIDDKKATILSASGNSITILTPFLPAGEHTLKVNYGEYSDSTKVFYVSKISGRLIDENNKPIYTTFTFYKNQSKMASFSTDSSGNYNLVLPPDYYDLKIDFPQASLFFENFYFEEKEGLITYAYKDSLSIKGLRVYEFYSFEFSGSYSSVNVELKYRKSTVEDEEKMKVFYCSNWNFANNECNSKWIKEDFVLDKVNSKVSLTLNHLSSFVLGRELSLRVSCSLNKNSFYLNETASINCLVEDEDGNAIENALVTLNLKGKTLSKKTNANGIASFEYEIENEGLFNVSVFAEKNPYLKANTTISFSAERKKEIFIAFPDTIKAERGSNATIDFSLVNTGQAPLTNIKTSLENLPFSYSFEKDVISMLLEGTKDENKITFFIPENSSLSTYSAKIKVTSKELETSKNFALTVIESSKPSIQTGFAVKLPTIKLNSSYVYLAIFAAISFSLAFFLKRMKKRTKTKVSYDDVFASLR